MQETANYKLKKLELTDFADITDLNSNADIIDRELKKLTDIKAPLESPVLTGTPAAPTPVNETNPQQIVNIEYVREALKKVDLSSKLDHTAVVQNADLNTLLDDKAYICVGTLKNTPVLNTYCIVRCYDGATTNRVVQICYIPQTDNTVRTFVRAVTSTTTFGKWVELGTVTSVNNVAADETGNVTIPTATPQKYGLVKVATEEDALKDDVQDAAITPAVYHDVSDFRHKQTAYNLGDKVECMFNHELFLECTQAGTTSTEPLDTRNVKHGQVLTDGGVQWTVRTHIKSVNGVVAGANGDVTVPQISASEIVNIVYPIGSLYWSKNSTNPTTLFGGTWVQIKDKFILAAGDTYKVGTTGGEAAHTLTIAELPAHNHTGTAANAVLNGAIDTTDNNEDARRCGTGDGTGILSSRENGSVFRYGKDGFVSAPTGIKINATHSHTISINNTGNGVAHNNMPPYVTYHCWERIA